jgi:multidrug efflux pump
MFLSDLSVKRPVFATVLSLLLVSLGILSFQELSVREYPDISSPVVSVETDYPGASADIVESRITQQLEGDLSGIAGVVSIDSSSRDGRSGINLEFELGMDMDDAANDVRDRVNRIINRLPDDIEMPRVTKQESDSSPIMYISLISENLGLMELTDYAERHIVDRFSVIPGISGLNVSGSGRPSMRVWLDRTEMAARGLTVTDVTEALRRENIELPAGRLESVEREYTVRIARNYQTAEDFRNLVIRQGPDDHLIRLGEIARVEVAPRNVRSLFRTNASNMIGMGIIKQSTANTVAVLDEVKQVIKRINKELPPGMSLVASTDDSLYIRAAIDSVYMTILETTILVSVVILLFLGSLRAMWIPVVTIPICLVSSFIALAAFGYSINLITLLALVLSIGLVVDDYIVVQENIHRRVEEGEAPLLAAFNGSRQVAFAVIATTVVLVSVFAPIIFLKDNMGQLFSELAVTICAAIIVSAVLALSLTPMMASKLLAPNTGKRKIEVLVDHVFHRIDHLYGNLLEKALHYRWVSILVLTVLALSAYGLVTRLPQEYAPTEDQGTFMGMITAAEGTSFNRMSQFVDEIEAPIKPYIESGDVVRAIVRIPGFGGNNSANSGVTFINLAPWNERKISTADLQRILTSAWSEIPGVRIFTRVNSGLSRRSGGQPVQFVIGGPDYETLARWRDIILERAEEYPGLTRVDHDLKETQPQVIVRIDKDRAAALGISVQSIGRTLQTMMSEQQVTSYVVDGEEYDVILQARDEQRATAADLQNIYVRSENSGELIPLTNLTRVEKIAGAASLNRYNRTRAVTISANVAPGYTLGDALDFLEKVVREDLPEGSSVDYRGESLEYKESFGAIYFTFGISLLVVFLVLAGQFESFVQPGVIMLTVPLALVGGLAGLVLSNGTLNIFSQIGLVILIGIAAKNGVLIVDFINQMRDAGMEFGVAVIEGARLRFRPVVMTSIATVMGSLPLMLTEGPGAESRRILGIVLFSGVSFATLLTLFIVPVFYSLLARSTASPNAIARRLDDLRTQAGP